MLWIYILFFVSGAPALIYQIVWQRALFTIYGVNIESVTIVVSAFMLGLGIGSLCGGAISKIPRLPTLAVFGLVELLIGIFGLFSLRIFHWVGVATASYPLLTVGCVTFLLVAIPTTLMGGTLPFLVAHLVRISRNVGSSVGTLYFVNTLGSAAACFISALFTMRQLGESGSVQLAAVLNFAVGLGAISRHFWTRRERSGEPEAGSPPALADSGSSLLPFPLAMILVALAGFIALSYEIVWFRAYSFMSGGSAQTFPLLLAAYLQGIACGSLFCKILCEKLAAGERTRLLRVIAVLLAGANVCSFLLVPVVARCAGSMHYIQTLPVVAVSAGLLGAVFPLVTHLAVAADDQAGARLSYLYLGNIFGSTVGTLVVGFVLMDLWSIRQLSVFLMELALAMTALLVVKSFQRTARAAVLTVTGLCAAAAIAGSPALFDAVYERLLFKWDYKPGVTFAHLVESRSGVVAVSHDGTVYGGGIYDGRFNTSLVDNTNMIARAYAVAALQRAPREALMIGLSSGSWAQVIANNPAVEKLTIVEINPAYLRLIPQYPQVAGLLRNRKVDIVIDDGRRWLVRNPRRRFDLVVMNTTYNWRAHISNLLSTDFLQIIRRHLNPGGVLFYNTTDSGEVQLTGVTAFPYAVRVINFLAVSDRPLEIDREAWRQTLVSYRIDGEPILDLGRQADRDVLERMLAMADSLRQETSTASAPMEYARTIRERHHGKRIITDDNMGTEWDQLR